MENIFDDFDLDIQKIDGNNSEADALTMDCFVTRIGCPPTWNCSLLCVSVNYVCQTDACPCGASVLPCTATAPLCK